MWCVVKVLGCVSSSSKTPITTPFANQHTELHVTSPWPTLSCFSPWASVLFPFDGLLSQPIETVMTIKLNPCVIFPPGWKASPRPLDRVIICLWVAEVACSAPTEQKRALITLTKAGEEGIHLPQHFSPGLTLWRTETGKLNSSSPPLGIHVAKKTFLCLRIVNNIKGFMENTIYFWKLLAECSRGCWTWSQIQYLGFGLFKIF